MHIRVSLVLQLFDLDNSNSIELEEFIAVVSLNDKILGKKRTADEPLQLDLGLLSQHLRQYKVSYNQETGSAKLEVNKYHTKIHYDQQSLNLRFNQLENKEKGSYKYSYFFYSGTYNFPYQPLYLYWGACTHMDSIIGLSLICSKFYLLFLPELSKILTHYSYFIPTSSPIIPTNFYCIGDNNLYNTHNDHCQCRLFFRIYMKYSSYLHGHLHHHHHLKQFLRLFHYIYINYSLMLVNVL